MNKREKAQVESRISYIKEIAQKLNAEYRYGIKSVKHPFDIEENTYNAESNIIVGSIDGYEYCFIESYNTHRNDNAFRWESKLYIRFKDNIPNMQLVTKETAASDFRFKLIFSLAFSVFPSILLIGFISKIGNDFKFIFPCLFLAVPVVFGILGFKDVYTLKKQINNQRIYSIKNKKFKEKYLILSKESTYSICRIFNEEVCSKIADYPTAINLNIHNNCTHLEFDYGEKLIYETCKEKLEKLLEQVKIFEKNQF